jgi:hypothetical protein
MNKKTIIASIFFSLFIACDILNDCKSTESCLDPIKDTILFQIIESYKTTDMKEIPKLELHLRSANIKKIYPCSNYRIVTDIKYYSQNINVELKGVDLPVNCDNGPSLASSQQFLNLDPGTYHLNFKFESLSDRHILTISDSSIQIESLSQNITRLNGKNIYFRYPHNSFAYLCRKKLEDSTLCESFLDSLKNAIKISEFTFPSFGYYSYPKSSSDEMFITDVRYFYYENDKDFDLAGKILKDYSKTHFENGSGSKIELQSWDNRRYYSWLM